MKSLIAGAIRPHLEQISKRLWNNKAVVMVGAGFSKNASATYPDWGQLGDKLYQLAHGKLPSGEDKAYLSLLKVAQEAEALVGRPAVDALLKSEIPDLQVAPSQLHTDLLQLPWNDVFTTNYDTLLERAAEKVIKHSYSTVVDQNDLPYAEKPRIVKLHGSFSSGKPFVVTEEDYRQYPKERAPFVNTVQQALLENTLVLIGFSGDDPNFLHWIGWIRDHLGSEHIQPIYLITSSQFSTAQTMLLGKRNIHVVDMSLCNVVACDDHNEGLREFLDFVRNQNPNRLDWPKLEYQSDVSLKLPSESIELSDLKGAIKEWKIQRDRYPGWLIVPHQNRSNLYYETKDWSEFSASNYKSVFDTISDGTDICFVFELVWRLDRCLLPMFDDIAELAQLLLDKYWPFSEIKSGKPYLVNLIEGKASQYNRKEIRSAWLALAFAALRYYREEGKENEWHNTKILLSQLDKYLSDEQKEQKQYQIYLFELFKLDIGAARLQLRQWKPKSSQPYWRYIHITAQMELGQLENQSLLIEECLTETRRQVHIGNDTCPYLASSEESYQMVMQMWAKMSVSESHPANDSEKDKMKKALWQQWQTVSQRRITNNKESDDIKHKSLLNNADGDWGDLVNKQHNDRKEEWRERLQAVRGYDEWVENVLYTARLDELKAVRIDPLEEISYLKLSIEQNKQLKTNQVFDIGRKSTSCFWFTENQKNRHAFSFLRFYEEAGIPLRFGNMSFAKESAMQTISHLAINAPNWVRATLFRLGDVKAVDILFDREAVQKITTIHADELVNKFIEALNGCKDKLKTKRSEVQYSIEYRLAQIVPEILSRLCCKCSIVSKEKMWEFITKLYVSNDKNNYENIAKLTRRLINSLSDSEKIHWLPRLLTLPVPISLTAYTEREYLNPFLWFELNKANSDLFLEKSIPDEYFSKLVSDAESGNAAIRKWALISLIRLNDLKLLNPEQVNKFGIVLWSKIGNDGFPDNTDGYYRFAFLDLPDPENVNKIKLVKDFIKNQDFPIQKKSKVKRWTVTGGRIDLVHNIIGAGNKLHNIWEHDDAVFWINRIIEWWDADKEILAEERDKKSENRIFGNGKEFHARLQRINELLATAIIPNLQSSLKRNSKVVVSVTRLLSELKADGLHTLQAEAEWLRFNPEEESNLLERIESAITSQDHELVQDALMAILGLLLGKYSDDLKDSVSAILAEFIKWCRTIKLSQALWLCIRVLRECPVAYSGLLENAVNQRLQKLINETDYSIEDSLFEFDDKLTIRELAMRLASELDTYYRKSEKSSPSVIQEWKNVAESQDEFAEIKNAWIFSPT